MLTPEQQSDVQANVTKRHAAAKKASDDGDDGHVYESRLTAVCLHHLPSWMGTFVCEEHVTESGHTSVDVVFTTPDGVLVAFQLEGSQHYIRWVSADGSAPLLRFNGSTQCRDADQAFEGYVSASINWVAFKALEKEPEMEAKLVAQQLQKALEKWAVTAPNPGADRARALAERVRAWLGV